MPPTWLVAFGIALCAPWGVALLRARPRALRAVALALCAVPLAIPVEHSVFRLFACIGLGTMCVKSFIAAAGHVPAPCYADFVAYLIVPAVTRWDAPRRRDWTRIARGVALGCLQVSTGLALMIVAVRLELRHGAAVVPLKQIELYLLIAGMANVAVAGLRATRGVDCDDAFHAPLLATSPADFWGRRWNTWVNATLYRYVFRPAGGRRQPARGTMAAFLVSGLVHEAMVDVASASFTGAMTAYFLLQGAAVAATSGWRPFRRLAAHVPAAAWLVTLTFMAVSGAIFVRGLDTAWDLHAEMAALLRSWRW
ncbi:MAG: MBOAT family protein [Myxococcota bacterium]